MSIYFSYFVVPFRHVDPVYRTLSDISIHFGLARLRVGALDIPSADILSVIEEILKHLLSLTKSCILTISSVPSTILDNDFNIFHATPHELQKPVSTQFGSRTRCCVWLADGRRDTFNSYEERKIL